MDSVNCDRCGMGVPKRLIKAAGTKKDANGDLLCALCNPPKGSIHASGRNWWAILRLLILVGAATAAFFLQKCSFEQVAEMRQIMRVPQTTVVAAVPGEVNLTGRAMQTSEANGRRGKTLLRSPDTGTQCVYFHYTVEREERDSDGDRRWVTIESRSDFVPFELKDSTGSIVIRPHRGEDFSVPESAQRRSGNLRYTEYRIDLSDRVFVFGYLQDRRGQNAERHADGAALTFVEFQSEGDYKPLISKKTELGERTKRGLGSIWLCWLGLCFSGVATAAVFSMAGLHRILVFFSLLSAVVAAVLFFLGFHMMRKDLTASQERVLRQEEVVRTTIQQELRQHGVQWSGDWQQLGEFSQFQEVPGNVRTRLRRVRIDLASAALRVRDQVHSFPYSLVAPLVKVGQPPAIPLGERDGEFLQKLDAQFQPARVSRFWGFVACGLGLAAGWFALHFGFRAIRKKRLVENLPTTPSSGITYGFTEIKGIIDLEDQEQSPLRGPVTGSPCLAYKYEIREKRGSGKDAKWVTIHSEERRQRFRCIDRDGEVHVDPVDAEVDAWRSESEMKGRQCHIESRLQLGDPVYVLGMAQVDPEVGDRLYIAASEDDRNNWFLISGFQEEFILRRGGIKGAMVLTVAFAAVLLAGLFFFGTLGSFNPASYLAAGLVGPAMMAVLAVIMHYNDLVFLRQRARRNWSNIDVALKKRHDLVPQLERVTSEAMNHEREVQEHLARLRAVGKQLGIPGQVADGHGAVAKLWALREQHPKLRTAKNMGGFMTTLITLENEIAFISQGYNDAVETYNTRIASFPDLLLASIGGFRKMELLNETPSRLRI